MRLFLYRTTDNDGDGDPLDHGIVRAGDIEMAAKHVRKHLVRLMIPAVPFKVYPMADRLTSGVLKDWEGEDSKTYEA